MFLRTLARPLLASWFVYGGVQAALEPQARAKRAEPFVRPLLDDAGVDVPVTQMVRVHGAATALAATALAFSKTPRSAALAVAGLAAVTTVGGQPFWTEAEPAARAESRDQFFKNLSLLGGALIAATAGHTGRRAKRRSAARKRRA